ncbi:MAG: erythronate-4-phosphate dehydrogenase, partial [Bacteroidota bacterium]|nr:erythronate-4-phosphate dehydrogenase [Bacteroidota bacterium]
MSKITAFIDSNIPLLAETLGSCVDICRFTGRGLSAKELIEGNCKYLFVRSTTKVNRELLDNTPVRFVGTATSGIDHIDSSFLESNRIAFADAPGSNANSVAEYVVFSILKWSLYKGIDLKGKSIGIIGYGNVGKIVGSYADNMKLKVFVNDPPLHDAGFEFPDYCKYSELSEISSCNIITNHVPLTNGGLYPTINLLDEKFITDMPNDSLFIHASRGGVADEDALLERMLKKEISGAIDVWYNEPLINSELAGLSIIATPHVAGYSRDGKLRGTLRMAQAFERHSGIK